MSDPRPSLEELRRLFNPRSIALIGAKEGSPRVAAFQQKMGQLGFDGPLHFVGRSGGTAGNGQLIARSCAEIGVPVDFAVIIAPAAAALDILDDLASASIPGAYLLASGWAETGAEGRAAQDALVAKARRVRCDDRGTEFARLRQLHDADGRLREQLPARRASRCRRDRVAKRGDGRRARRDGA